jgi:hypothetical protein
MSLEQKSVSLASVEANEQVVIRKVLYPSLRLLCGKLGLVPGESVICRASSAHRLYLRTSSGRRIALERDQARFIQVAPAGNDGAAHTG